MVTETIPFSVTGSAGSLTGFEMNPQAVGKTPVVFVHGINMSSKVWDRVLGELGSDRRLIALDLRGHGGSGREGPFSANDYADDVVSVLDHLDVERAHVVGTSFGGMVAVVLAARQPARVASITAIGSALAVEGMDLEGAKAALRGMGVRAFYEMILPQASFGPNAAQELIDEALEMASANRDVELVIDVSITAFTSDVTAEAAQVQCKALVMAGKLDLTCPTPLGESLARALHTELVLVPGHGHVVVAEAPGDTAALVRAHLDDIE